MKEKTNKKKPSSKEKIKEALLKKALGYDCTETVEEYVSEEGEIRLTKKKITKKNVPPDMSALKILLEESAIPVTEMSDEELNEEKMRLIKILAEENVKEK